ncbi:MAG: SusC/RagA family TonB-linked outer membrane protein [Saprospiraceae bacterium]|jgi:iron complex outermembrane receptor protein|nr:SusC/RagA family TonB-linked outer membrane protein [Saprospiraceae bacterium]
MKSFLTKWSFSLLLLVGTTAAVISQKTISGVVTDAANGEALIGANVLLKGTATGTITDINGSYSLKASVGDVLVISYAGYSDQMVTVGQSSTINIALAAGKLLEEIVVTGYGTQSRRDISGAVTSIKSGDFNGGVISSAENLIQGKAAGVQIVNTNGDPGGGVNIRIRGTSSIRSGNGPLYVVDGVPLDGGNINAGSPDLGAGDGASRNPLNFINPADIASMDILKDASATAIYGARGANGVVLITTKKGSSSASQGLQYSASVSSSTITKKFDLLDGPSYIKGAVALGGNATTLNKGGNTDWQDQIFRTAISNNHNLSYGSGSSASNYRISLGYQDQEGIIEETSMKRYTVRANTSHKMFNDKLIIEAQFTYANVKDQAAPLSDNAGYEGSVLGAALSLNPTQNVVDSKGAFIQAGNDQRNPVAWLAYHDDRSNLNRMLGSVSATYNISSSLSYKLNFGADRSASSRKAAVSRLFNINDIGGNGRAFILNLNSENTLLEHTLNYKTNLGVNNRLDAVVGYSYQKYDNSSTSIRMQRFKTDDLSQMINNPQAVNFQNNNDAYRVTGGASIDELQSFFGRVRYVINDKYDFSGTLRADGSSKFGGNNQYGIFPAFNIGWRLSEEEFIPDVFSTLKLRAGWGRTGNQEFGGGNQISRKRYNNDGNLEDASFANPDLKWETTDQLNVGIDYEFNNGKLFGSIDFFNKKTNDLLVRTSSAQPAPQPFVWENLKGNVKNTGIEFSLGSELVRSSNLVWNINGNVTYIKNEVQNTGRRIQTGAINGQGLSGAYAQLIADGQPLYAYYLRTFQGFDAEGLNIYKDNEAVEFVDKSPLPKLTLGLTNNFKFGNMDVNIFFNGMFGHYIYNNTANAFSSGGGLANGRNAFTNIPGNGESGVNSADASTRFLEKGDFLRLQNLTIGYNVPMSNATIKGLRVYLTAQNLLTFTGYSGQDPEVDTNKAIDGVPSAGIDYLSYPRARTFTVGANVNF